jgi:hypothetical protein
MKKDQRIRFIVERALREMENFAEKISTLKHHSKGSARKRN